MALTILPVLTIVDLCPEAAGQGLLRKEMDRVPEIFITSPPLMNLSFCTRAYGYWRCSTKALQSLSISPYVSELMPTLFIPVTGTSTGIVDLPVETPNHPTLCPFFSGEVQLERVTQMDKVAEFYARWFENKSDREFLLLRLLLKS